MNENEHIIWQAYVAWTETRKAAGYEEIYLPLVAFKAGWEARGNTGLGHGDHGAVS